MPRCLRSRAFTALDVFCALGAFVGMGLLFFAPRSLFAQSSARGAVGAASANAGVVGFADGAATASAFTPAQRPLSDVCFEVTRYCATGFSALSQAASLAPLSRRAASIMTRPVMQAGGRVLFLCELYAPERVGVLASTYCASDTLPPSLVDWVDVALLSLAVGADEKLPLSTPADDYEEELDIGRDASDVLAALDNRAGEALQPEVAEGELPIEFVDSTEKLRRFNYGVEDFAVSELDGMLYLTDSADKRIVRRAYDSRMRLVTTEAFFMPSDARTLTRSSLRTQRYRGESLVPYEREEVDYGKQTRVVIAYNAAGLSARRELFHTETVASDDAASSDETEPLPPETRELQDSRTEWTYTAEGKVLSETVTTWQTELTKKGEVRKSRVVRRDYRYGGKGTVPDVDYYEDDVLRLRTVYAGENEYTETLFFDGGFSVETTYVNHNKTLEVILLNGQEQRRRSFAD